MLDEAVSLDDRPCGAAVLACVRADHPSNCNDAPRTLPGRAARGGFPIAHNGFTIK